MKYRPQTRFARRRSFPLQAVQVMDDWLAEHAENPYPTSSERDLIAMAAGITAKQVGNWFANARRRRLQMTPMESYLSSSADEENKADTALAASQYPYRDFGASKQPTWEIAQSPSKAGSCMNAEAGSVGPAFSQCSSARVRGPPRQGRKRIAHSRAAKRVTTHPRGVAHRCSSARSAARVLTY